MQSTTHTARSSGIRAAFKSVENWLDQFGRKGWIIAMVLGFIFVWPVGLALLAYMIWGKRMFSRSCGNRSHMSEMRFGQHAHRAAQATGNLAFDSYKAEALRRLEDEQAAFEAFLQRLRTSKDKSEFDAFMDDRARTTAQQDAADTADTATEAAAKPATDARTAESRPGEY